MLAGALTYANGLSAPFAFDDQLSIVENTSIRQWNPRTLFFPERELPVAGRPLVNVTFAVNYALGGLDVAGYHVVNVAWHLLSALLVFGLVRRTLNLSGIDERLAGRSADIGFAAALLWIVHPLNTEAVNYVTQRTELMMAFFYLATLYASLRNWKAAAIVSCAAGMACKESMVTAPVAVLLYDAVFLYGGVRQAMAGRWRFYAGLALTWALLAALLWSGPRIHSAGFGTGVSPWTYLLNQAPMIVQYLKLTVWPRALVANYGWPLPVTLGDVLPQALFVVLLLALTASALVRWPRVGFLGAWVFITLAPTSSLVPIATEVGAERRMYLPLIGLVTLAVVAVSSMPRLRPRMAAAVLLSCAAALAGGTVLRNRDYDSSLELARTTVERRPGSVAHHLLGSELLRAGATTEEAIQHLRQALPGAPRARYTLGAELLRQGQTDEAIEQLQQFLEEQPFLLEAVSARQLLGQAFARRQQWAEAIEQYRRVLTMNPSLPQRLDTQGLLAVGLFQAERYDEAIDAYRQYLARRPGDIDALTNLGIALVAAERPDEALDAFRRAVELDPGNADRRRNLATALFDSRNIDEAALHARQAVALRPGDPAAHDLFGRVLAVQGRLAEAQAEFERALQVAPDYQEARENLARLERLKAATGR
ncbi:MAG: hypothetical protein A3F70_14250 [Acidobacteria bacterium RIFCSPLOWO2_12_FULL_67_14]|nr:MAG: hypothetical protein A3F70_14250 [Acidobacteria bacterium RIFCSPLOWO2_12_FULL_67_14]